MSLSLTATAEPTHSPPRIAITATESLPENTITSLSLFRDGVPLRFDPIIAGGTAIAYDYDAAFDVPLVYRADGVEAGVTVDWTETWASLASWFSPPSDSVAAGWAVSAGVASSTASNAVIYRNSTGTIGRVEVVNPSNVTVQLATADNLVLAAVTTSPDGTVTVTGSAGGQTVTGSGSYTIDVADKSFYVAGSGWSTTVARTGTATRLRIVAPPGAVYVSQFGIYGTGNGEFNDPQGVAVDGSGNIYVVDGRNNRVQKLNSAGVYQSQFGSSGSGNGQFDSPTDIAIDGSGNIFVVDTENDRVQKFNSSGVYQSQFGTTGSGNGQFSGPVGIVIDGSGNMFVTDYANNRVQKFNSSGTYQSQFGTAGSGNGQFGGPIGIARDASGNLYVTDRDNSRVQKFNSSGVYQSQFGTAGSGNGQFNWPLDIAIDSGGRIFVADYFNNRVQQFDSSGVYVAQFGGYGTGNGQFERPLSLAIDGTNLYVNDDVHTGVQKFTTQTGSIDDVTVYKPSSTITVTATDTETLSPTGVYAGAWLTNAAQPDLAALINVTPDTSSSPYFMLATTHEDGTFDSNIAQIRIEGSPTVISAVLGDRLGETWALAIGCTTIVAMRALEALLANSSAVSLRVPSGDEYAELDNGFYAVGPVSRSRVGHPAMGPIHVLTLPLTPSLAPAFSPLWQWNWGTLAQSGMTWGDVMNAFPNWLALLTGPS